MRKLIRFLLVPAVLIGFMPIAMAQENANEKTFDSYVVNFNTFPSDFLDVKIAKAVKIKRSESNGVITIAVRQKVPGSPDKSTKADVDGTATNLIGQMNKIKFSEIRDGEVIYYLGTYTIVQHERIVFNVTILPAGEMHPYTLDFARQF